MIYALGHLSGAHINPAVTIAFWSVRRFPASEVLPYVVNPARSFGPALIGGLWRAHWLYWLAPITGMLAAARGYDFLRHAEPPRAPAPGRPLGVQGPIDRAITR